MTRTKEKLLIIDGNALIHRSFHALPPTMKTKNGVLTNAVFGFTSFLLRAIKEMRPEYVALTLDRKAPTFRHEKYKEYKATRVKAPDELYEQIPLVKKVVASFNIPIYELDGYEADDLIGTIAKSKIEALKTKNIESIIITGDADTLQLVDENTKVYSMSRGINDSVLYDEKMVEEKYGLRVDQLVDYKALRGDPSDNIPGVKGIGEKTAVELLKSFGTLEELYVAIEDKEAELNIKPRIIELLKTYKEDAFLSKELAMINKEVPIDFDLESARFGVFDKNIIIDLFGELEFKSLLSRINDVAVLDEKGADGNEMNKFERDKKLFKYTLINNEKEFAAFLQELKKQPEFVFDTETTGLDPLLCDLLGIGFCWSEGLAYFVNLKSFIKPKVDKVENLNLFNYGGKDQDLNKPERDWLIRLKPIFENKKIKKIGHNLKYDVRVLKSYDIGVKNIAFDTMIASYLLNPGNRQHSLDAAVFSELGFEKISKEDLLGRGREKKNFAEVEIDKLFIYCCEDADFAFRLAKKFEKELKENNLEELFQAIEMPLLPVLAYMEENGIAIDPQFLATMEKVFSEKIHALEKEIYGLAGQEFNVRSTQQLKKILFEDLKISTEGVGKIKTGFSTSAEDLEKLRDRHSVISLIIEHRELSKLVSTYITALPELINKKTKRVHTSYNQTVAATGRLSSTDPNLQNIPIRTELGREIRKAFVSEKGYKLLALDYSQIELRIAAHLSGDEVMIQAFKNKADIHTETAAKVNNISAAEVTKDMRRDAKAINFGILYGQGAHGLSQVTGISFGQAKEFIEQYFKAFSGVKKYLEKTIEETRESGYVETFFGRRRYLPEINSTIPLIKKAAERMAVNTPIQGTAADIIKMAMIKVEEKLRDNKEIMMLLQVHDELVFEVIEGKEKEYYEIIKKIMESVVDFKVPIIAEGRVGKNWGEMTAL